MAVQDQADTGQETGPDRPDGRQLELDTDTSVGGRKPGAVIYETYRLV